MSPPGRSGALMFLLRYKCTPRLPYHENVSANPLGRLFSREIEASVVYGSTKSGARVRCDIGIDEILPYRNGSGNDGREITICCCRAPSNLVRPSTMPMCSLGWKTPKPPRS